MGNLYFILTTYIINRIFHMITSMVNRLFDNITPTLIKINMILCHCMTFHLTTTDTYNHTVVTVL